MSANRIQQNDKWRNVFSFRRNLTQSCALLVALLRQNRFLINVNRVVGLYWTTEQSFAARKFHLRTTFCATDSIIKCWRQRLWHLLWFVWHCWNGGRDWRAGFKFVLKRCRHKFARSERRIFVRFTTEWFEWAISCDDDCEQENNCFIRSSRYSKDYCSVSLIDKMSHFNLERQINQATKMDDKLQGPMPRFVHIVEIK